MSFKNFKRDYKGILHEVAENGSVEDVDGCLNKILFTIIRTGGKQRIFIMKRGTSNTPLMIFESFIWSGSQIEIKPWD